MTVERTNPEGLHRPVDNLYSHVVVASGSLVRLSGMVAVDVEGRPVAVGDMAGQIRCCYDQVTLALASQGLTWDHVMHLYTFTTDMSAYMEHEKGIVVDYFGDHPPASTLVEVSRLVEPEWLVEVQADAVVPGVSRVRG